jgi:hypothetical protein
MSKLGKKLIRLRKARGWSVYGACQEMPNVGRESLRRLEEGIAKPGLVGIQTCIDLLIAYHPDLDLSDFANTATLSRLRKRHRRSS